MTDLTARMLAKADRERAFRNLEEAAAQSQRDVRAGLRDELGNPTRKGRLVAVAPSAPTRPAPRARKPRPTADIITRYQNEASMREIAVALGLTVHGVRAELMAAGVTLRPSGGDVRKKTAA